MSGGGFGSIPYGGGPFGGPFAVFGVASVEAIDYRTIEVTFTTALATDAVNLALISSLGSYSITPHVQVVAAVAVSGAPTKIRVYTLPQSPGATYRIEVIGNILSQYGEAIGNRIGTWVALAAPAKFLVSELEARAECQGKSVYLRWSNPSGTTTNKIVRRLKAWPFDLTDTHDIVYVGDPVEEFIDTGIITPQCELTEAVDVGDLTIEVASHTGLNTGDLVRVESLIGTRPYDILTIASFPDSTHITFTTGSTHAYAVATTTRVSKSTQLQGQTYYYYTVMASDDGDYDIDDPSRVMGLSIDDYFEQGKAWWISNTTAHNLSEDAKELSEGGGGGFLDKWFTVMGCWLARMRGEINALKLTADPDATPFHTLTAKNQALGIDPEGFAFDFDIVRRPLTSLVYVYKRKGTCPGIIETVRMFTKWDAECREFAFAQCQGGATAVTTWDGVSQLEYGEETDVTDVEIVVTSAEGAARFVDAEKTWADDLWKDGTLRGWIGDIACVDTNANDSEITIFAPRGVTTLSGAHTAGATTLSVVSTSGLIEGLDIQIINATETSLGSGEYASEIVTIISVDAAGDEVTIFGQGLENSYADGSRVSIGKSILRREIVNEGTGSGQVLTDSTALWVDHQWRGYKLLTSDNVEHNITDNTGTTLTVDGAAPPAGPAAYAIAKDFDVNANFGLRKPLLRYKVSNGVHTTWWEPTFDIELSGTVYDPFNRLWNGSGLALTGVFGANDVGVYILTDVVQGKGTASSVSGFVFDLDPSQPAPSTNEWQGMFLNPNQNQEQLFEILENDATTVTVAGDISSLVVAGQYYYVLAPRDRIRFQRLTRRLRKEFTDTDVNIHVLFV